MGLKLHFHFSTSQNIPNYVAIRLDSYSRAIINFENYIIPNGWGLDYIEKFSNPLAIADGLQIHGLGVVTLGLKIKQWAQHTAYAKIVSVMAPQKGGCLLSPPFASCCPI